MKQLDGETPTVFQQRRNDAVFNFSVGIMKCCAVREVSGLAQVNDPDDSLALIYHKGLQGGARGCSTLLFTGVSGRPYCEDLATRITDLKLGIVTKVSAGRNPNTNNQVSIWLWQFDPAAFDRWGRTEGLERYRALTMATPTKPVSPPAANQQPQAAATCRPGMIVVPSTATISATPLTPDGRA